MNTKVRVFIACSLDGFIAGEGGDLSWLPQPQDGITEDHGYHAFFADVGALLMGRASYDVVMGFGVEWPYQDRPVLVATHRELESSIPTVRPVRGDIHELVARARDAAAGRDVYVDGGNVIRQALDARLVDELVVTVVPVVLGRGLPLFAGSERRTPLALVSCRSFDTGMVQLTYRPA